MNVSADTTKDYECTGCGSYALMHTNPNLTPGVWECTNEDCGLCGYCEHLGERHVETDEDNQGHPVRFYVCDDCEQEIARDIADPDEDAYDVKVNMQIDMAVGK